MRWTDRLYRVPPVIAGGSIASSWVGMLLAWAAAGFGAAAAARSAGILISFDEGACSTSDAVCQVSGWGGLLLGVVALFGAPVLSLFAARGFGPPVTWWVLAIGLGAIAAAPFSTAEGALLSPLWLLLSGVAAVLALLLAVGAVRRGWPALVGWIRLDGLDAREVPLRAVDRLVMVAALAAAIAGAVFGGHVIRLLADA
ncbi:hypothetical protein OVA14_05760 [Agrococcus sp. SL85]|uniref:hypothetical protein n=1 Tax=Agrococcus sp. SL85 TaxID=2995141 RepID=UPI00226C6EE6|nr:hypothetical protein [Agrococcus sp. SL85]WAC67243.1 hypothetical protein OVA14_05760 [Agrococcus sp. SL85]